MVNKSKLDQKLTLLRGYLEVLEGLGAEPKEAFLSNADKIGNAKYHFVVAIECCIDIANHIISSEGYRFPEDNADCFTVLTEEGVLKPEWEETLRAMARFRNRLVHIYWDIDNERIHDYLQGPLGSMEKFRRAVAERPW